MVSMSLMRECLYCKKWFNAKSERQIYCSHSCMNTAQQLRWKKNHPEKAKETNKRCAKQWQKEHPDKVKIINARYIEKNKEKIMLRLKNTRIKKREQLLSLIGSKCLICGSDLYIHFHEVYGKKHMSNHITTSKYYLEHFKDFVPLCSKHHKIIHELSRLNEIDYFKLLLLVERIHQ